MWTFLVKIGEHIAGWWYSLRAKIGGAKVDISQVNAQIWTGGALTTDADVAQLVADGITADIDCREEFNDQSLIDGYNNLPPTPDSAKNHPKIAYLYDGVADDGQPKPTSWFSAAWEFACPILEGREGAPGVVLAHCAAGVNRGPSMAYFLLRAHWKLGPAEALALLKSKRPQVGVAYRGDADRAITELGLA